MYRAITLQVSGRCKWESKDNLKKKGSPFTRLSRCFLLNDGTRACVVRWSFIQERTTRDGGISGMKMQADISLLQAHYALLEQRLEEVESQLSLVQRGIHTLIGGGDSNRLRLVKEDRSPIDRKELPRLDFDVDDEIEKIKKKKTKDKRIK